MFKTRSDNLLAGARANRASGHMDLNSEVATPPDRGSPDPQRVEQAGAVQKFQALSSFNLLRLGRPVPNAALAFEAFEFGPKICLTRPNPSINLSASVDKWSTVSSRVVEGLAL